MMSKKGISQIKGPSEIRLGETAYYEVSRIYDLDDKKKVDAARWKLYALDFKHHGNWRELTPKAGTPPKIGYRVPVIVTNQSLVGSELMLEAYIYEPEKRIPPGLRIKVLPGIEKKITRVDLFKVDDTPIKDDTVMKYGQTIKVKVYTQNMQNEMMKLSLYEDDAQGGGDSPKNKNSRVAYTKKPLNKKGFLVHEFKLNIDFAKIANAVMDGSHDKLHEYYVVVETAEHKSVSKNVDVQNPDYVKVQTVSSGVDTEKIYEGIVIEEVVITGKYKKQPGINPPVNTGNKVVTVFETDEKKKKKEEVCEYEARVRAFIRMLRVGEGTDSEKGYTTQFSGKQFSNMNNHPHEVITANGYSSSAAGAYQIMSDTYDGLKTYRNKYNIKGFDQESQDKLCLVILKHNYVDDRPNSFYNPIYWKDKKKTIRDIERENKTIERRKKFKGQQADIIKLVIDNDIKKATLLSSLCWASLPDAPYGQPTETAAECKANYEKFLKEELTNKQTWKLHLKDGFLKEFGYSCCDGEATNFAPTKGCGDKIDIDLRDKMIFHPQKTKTDCNLQCRKIMSSLSVVPENPTESGKESFYQTAIESKNHKSLVLNSDDFKNGMNYIDKSLEAGLPIMVGVNHTLNYGYNESTNTTDHYVIIVGRFCDNGILKYRFWDVATRRGAEGDFKFTLAAEKLFSDNVWKVGRTYTLTQIRRNINSKGKLITY